MRQTFLGLVCLTFLSSTYETVSAHEPDGRAFDASAVRVQHAALRVPRLDEICSDAEDCVAEAPLQVRRKQSWNVTWFKPERSVAAAIANASATTGVAFDYLLRTAALESSLDPLRVARTSSATGLYQFVEQTWLYMMREIGPEFGFRDLAQAIVAGEGGYEVSDAALRAEILWLRYDPGLSAVLAGVFTTHNARVLARALDRQPHAGELYLAHVLGASGAARLVRLCDEDPEADASKHFGRAARANRAIFYEDGKPRTAIEVYDFLVNKYEGIPVLADEHRPSAPAVRPVWLSPPLPTRFLGDDAPIHAAI